MSVIVTCKATIFEQYINSYEYIHDNDGFIEPIEEFKEWFDYIVNFYDIYDNLYNELLIKKPNKPFEESPTLLDPNDYFDFEFPDEETALYFKLKYCS